MSLKITITIKGVPDADILKELHQDYAKGTGATVEAKLETE